MKIGNKDNVFGSIWYLDEDHTIFYVFIYA